MPDKVEKLKRSPPYKLGVPYKVNINAIVEDSDIPVESKELHDKVSRLPTSAPLLDINPAEPVVESKPLHEKVQLLPLFSPMRVKAKIIKERLPDNPLHLDYHL